MNHGRATVAAVNGYAILAIAVVGWFSWLFRDLPHASLGFPPFLLALGVILPLWVVGAARAKHDERTKRR
ncbi:hypothetical protein [Demequina phytophila]|uniref:hypothetical protein n=1 Tax=Demequina phytophila TaxID=1638981 RepID=UPI00078485B0|nr:hypothetical protein [Demequina phytophila]